MTIVEKIQYVVSALFWGAGYLVIRAGVSGPESYDPLMFASIEMVLCALIAWSLRLGFPSLTGQITSYQVTRLGALGCLNSVAMAVLFTAERSVSAATAAVIGSLSPIILAAFVLVRERTLGSRKALLAVAFGFTGVCLLFWKQPQGGQIKGLFQVLIYAAFNAVFVSRLKAYSKLLTGVDAICILFSSMAITLSLLRLIIGGKPLEGFQIAPNLVVLIMAVMTVIPYMINIKIAKALTEVQLCSMQLLVPLIALAGDKVFESRAPMPLAGYLGATLIVTAQIFCYPRKARA